MMSGVRRFFSSSRPSSAAVRVRVTNLTRDTTLATCMDVADNGSARNRGLLGREGLVPGEGLWIIPCQAVHTFWMRFSIDLIYLDSKKRIRKLVSNVPAWRLSGCLVAHSVLELPPGTIRETRTQRGDVLAFLVLSA